MTVPAPHAAAAKELELVEIKKFYGAVPAVRGVSLRVPAGTMTSLIGPSGCGKTTTLRMIAGLEKPTSGRIVVAGQPVSDGQVSVPIHLRDMGMVFQSYALWPHMTVEQNVGYGLRQRKKSRHDIKVKVDEVLSTVDMARFAQRYPSQLSGGQQQRVALARAIATEPSILLFDEPLSNLDAMLREQMRFEIRTLQQRLGITAVYVTHSQDEALALSDQIAVMRDGVIVQLGSPLDIYNHPKSEFAATFIGLTNILTLSGIQRRGSGFSGALPGGLRIDFTSDAETLPDSVKVSLRPSDIKVGGVDGSSDYENVCQGTVRLVSFTGGIVDYFIRLNNSDAELRVQTTPPILAEAGQAVTLSFRASRVVALDG